MRRAQCLILGFPFLLMIARSAAGDQPDTKPKSDQVTYVCPSCGCKSDSNTFEKPGKCPDCKMGLVRKEEFHAPRKVAIVVAEGVTALDLAGPAEVFSNTLGASGRAFEVFTVGASKEPVDSRHSVLSLTPERTFADCPKPDIIVIPGGGTESLAGDAAFIEWLKKSAEQSSYIMSISNGTMLLAKAGLLDNQEATTAFWMARRLQQEYPKVKVIEGKTVVASGKIITTAASATSIDAALLIVERIHGPEAAQNTAEAIDYFQRPQ